MNRSASIKDVANQAGVAVGTVSNVLNYPDRVSQRTKERVLHAIEELPNAINPPTGWVQNTNAWPYRAAGDFSPNPVRYPKYMDLFGENFRGLRALQLLNRSRNWTLGRLQAAAFDSYHTEAAVHRVSAAPLVLSPGDRQLLYYYQNRVESLGVSL